MNLGSFRFLNTSFGLLVSLLLTAKLAFASHGLQDEFAAARQAFQSGDYQTCLTTLNTVITARPTEAAYRLAIETNNILGNYAEASSISDASLERFPYSVQLRWEAAESQRFCGAAKRSKELLDEIHDLAQFNSSRFRKPDDQLVLAEYYLAQGDDAKGVLKQFLQPLPKTNVAANLAIGKLALSKGDFQLAAEHFQIAADLDPTQPKAFFGLAEAFRPSDADRSNDFLEKALDLNPAFIPALLFVAERKIDGERYGDAIEILNRVFDVNDYHTAGLALRAVIHHLNNEPSLESACREKALSTWKGNPEFDFVIGRKLSQKYRFVEGAEYQQRALVYAPDYLPAKLQLAQDQLRLGNELNGWKLADEVVAEDGYSVMAHNLSTLRDSLSQYTTIQTDDFVIRMDAKEARVYGDLVLNLLTDAKAKLCNSYEHEISKPIYVEVFAKQSDFAVRTFGMPGYSGYLGVCFGNVVTMNSPVTQGTYASNWQAVLWHEFCHVVTLQKTKNKMPRWLSEGISVYEERKYNPAWGQSMTARYREMTLGDELTPVSQLSDAFLAPPTGEHLLFAYYESSMVVEYLVETYGRDVLNRLLVDLGLGMKANEALTHYVGSLEQFDSDFKNFMHEQANTFASVEQMRKLNEVELATAEGFAELNLLQSDNFYLLRDNAMKLMSEKRWAEAVAILTRIDEVFPNYRGDNDPWEAIAIAKREMGDRTGQREALEKFVARDAVAFDARTELVSLLLEEQDYKQARTVVNEMLGINPMIALPHELMVATSLPLNDDVALASAWSSLLEMEPTDPAETHFQLARVLSRLQRNVEAKRQVLKALEYAPKFRDAQLLLLELVSSEAQSSGAQIESREPSGDREINTEDGR